MWGPNQSGDNPDWVVAALVAVAMLAAFIGAPALGVWLYVSRI